MSDVINCLTKFECTCGVNSIHRSNNGYFYLSKSTGNLYRCCRDSDCFEMKQLSLINPNSFEMPSITDEGLAKAFVEMYDDILTIDDEGEITGYTFSGLFWEKNGYNELQWNKRLSNEFYQNLRAKLFSILDQTEDDEKRKDLFCKLRKLEVLQVLYAVHFLSFCVC